MQEIDDHRWVLRPARAAQGGAAEFVDFGDIRVGDRNRREAGGRIEAKIPVADAQHVPHAVVVRQLEVDRANDVVKSRTEAAAGNDRRGRVKRVKIDLLPWPGLLKQEVLVWGLRRSVELVADARCAGDKIAEAVVMLGR